MRPNRDPSSPLRPASHAHPARAGLARLARGLAAAAGAASLGACSVLSPVPTYELIKAAGSGITAAIHVAPPNATDTVYHYHPPFKSVCIEYNRDSQAGDVVPALQVELRRIGIDSRVYEQGAYPNSCPVWLRYTTAVEWTDDDPPVLNLSDAALVLQSADGRVLSSSRLAIGNSVLGQGKSASTRNKLAPVVRALVTGFES